MNKEKLAKHRTLNGDDIQETRFGRVRLFVLCSIFEFFNLVIVCLAAFPHYHYVSFNCLFVHVALTILLLLYRLGQSTQYI